MTLETPKADITNAPSFLLSLPRWQAYSKLKKVVPTRFNRQRREVCFVPRGHQKPIFVPLPQASNIG